MLVFVGRFLDLALHIPRFYGAQHTAQRVDLLDAGAGSGLDLIRQMLDGIGAADGVHRIGDSALVGQDLLGAQSEASGILHGQRQGFVKCVGVQRLTSAQHRCERLDRHAHDIILRLLRRKRRAGGLCMEAQHHRARVASAEAIAHQPRPKPARRAVLGDLFEEIVMRVEEKGKPRRKVIHPETCSYRRIDVSDGIA